MFSQLIKQCIQTSLYKTNSFQINVRFVSQIPTKVQQIVKENTDVKDKNIPKSRYHGYQVIYNLPFINYLSIFNKTKWYMLLGTGMIVPTMCICSGMNVISEVTSLLIAGFACSSTISIFISGIVCDNQIGFIYYKDEKTIKIAYVDIWGQRIDINTSVEDIKSLTDAKTTITDRLYRTIHLKSLKHPLKLIVKNSRVHNKDRLVSILGDYE